MCQRCICCPHKINIKKISADFQPNEVNKRKKLRPVFNSYTSQQRSHVETLQYFLFLCLHQVISLQQCDVFTKIHQPLERRWSQVRHLWHLYNMTCDQCLVNGPIRGKIPAGMTVRSGDWPEGDSAGDLQPATTGNTPTNTWTESVVAPFNNNYFVCVFLVFLSSDQTFWAAEDHLRCSLYLQDAFTDPPLHNGDARLRRCPPPAASALHGNDPLHQQGQHHLDGEAESAESPWLTGSWGEEKLKSTCQHQFCFHFFFFWFSCSRQGRTSITLMSGECSSCVGPCWRDLGCHKCKSEQSKHNGI